MLTNVKLTLFIHKRKDQYTSCSAHHGEPQLCSCLRTTCISFGYFLGWVILPDPQPTITDHDGPAQPTFRLRGGDVIT